MLILIDHPDYGERVVFADLNEAEQAYRECVTDWDDTWDGAHFEVLPNGAVRDDRGQVVGREVEAWERA